MWDFESLKTSLFHFDIVVLLHLVDVVDNVFQVFYIFVDAFFLPINYWEEGIKVSNCCEYICFPFQFHLFLLFVFTISVIRYIRRYIRLGSLWSLDKLVHFNCSLILQCLICFQPYPVQFSFQVFYYSLLVVWLGTFLCLPLLFFMAPHLLINILQRESCIGYINE